MKEKNLKIDSLNGHITIEEIKQTVKKMKNKEVSGNGSITNEIISALTNKCWYFGKTIQQNLN